MKYEKSVSGINPPGYPGMTSSWTSSSKSAVGTSNTRESRIWFTLSKGIVNEVYYPRIDQVNTRDLGFLVTDGSEFFEEEKQHCKHQIAPLAQGVQGFHLTNTSKQGRYRIIKTVLTDPRRDVLLQQVHFEPLQGKLTDYHLYALLAPHIKNHGFGNNGWVGDYKGVSMLFAQREDIVLALACSTPFLGMSCGYSGFSDGWQDINKHKRMTQFYAQASNGNIALTAEIDLSVHDGNFVLALAFGNNAAEAGQLARAALLKDLAQTINDFKQSWHEFQKKCQDMGKLGEKGFDLYRLSTAILKTHMDKRFSDGLIASLSIPWGFAKGDNDLGGYHLIWPRDLVEAAGGLLAAGDIVSTRQILIYLMCTQEEDGHWPQNMWLDGTPYWQGVQMDETAFPILLASAMKRINRLGNLEVWPMIKRAAGFLARNGPVSQEDRWEEDPGYSPFTLAVEIAALLAAADFADDVGETQLAKYLKEIADAWNSSIERWIYITNTELANKVGIEGYYVRISPPDVADASSPLKGFVPIKNRPPGKSNEPFEYIISPDALALVRFGLRAADDPHIVNTVKVIDAILKTETKTGPVWHRYNLDGYGEHEDGNPFDGIGIGRGWPLLAGERAHYELAKNNIKEAERLLQVIEAQTGPGGLIPEQVWDAPDIPEKNLINGHPSGSAMPLVWAHAEYIKLLRSLRDGRIFDMPTQTVQRYLVDKTVSPLVIWRFNHKLRNMLAGKILRVELLAPAIIHWSMDDWNTVNDIKTTDTGLGIYYADLLTNRLPVGTRVVFTFHWLETNQWEGVNFNVILKKE